MSETTEGARMLATVRIESAATAALADSGCKAIALMLPHLAARMVADEDGNAHAQ